MADISGLRFVRVKVQSIEEAKRRAMVVGLVSYDPNNHTFIRLYTKSGLRDPFFFTKLKQYW